MVRTVFTPHNKMFPIEFEAGLIRLLDKLTNGSRIEVNKTGNSTVMPRRISSKGVIVEEGPASSTTLVYC